MCPTCPIYAQINFNKMATSFRFTVHFAERRDLCSRPPLLHLQLVWIGYKPQKKNCDDAADSDRKFSLHSALRLCGAFGDIPTPMLIISSSKLF